MLLSRPVAWAIAAVAFVAAVLALGQIGGDYVIFLANQVLIATISALGLNLLTGFAGQVSIGNAAFMGIGAYTAFAFSHTLGFAGAVFAGGLAGALVGLIIGIPSLRLRGFYLLLSTLALQYLVAFGLEEIQVLAHSPSGFTLPPPQFGAWHVDSDRAWFPILFVATGIALYTCANLSNGKLGRAWMAIRDHDVAAAVIGINVTAYKLGAFVVSSFWIAVAGALAGYYGQAITYETYDLNLAVSFAAMIIIGGMGTIAGAAIGAAVVTLLPAAIRFAADTIGQGNTTGGYVQSHLGPINLAVYALIVLLFLRFEPKGILALIERLAARLRPRPPPQSAGKEAA